MQPKFQGWRRARLCPSYKTREPAGNLQLTFSRKGTTGADYLVDVDIDEAQGIAHSCEVVRNVFTGLTNPYNVREILTADQGLKSLYPVVFAQKKLRVPRQQPRFP